MKPLYIGLTVVLVLASVIASMGIKENFGFFDNLWPSRDTYCEARGLKKSYMPQKCIILDDCGRVKAWDRYRNCRCVDPKTGFCQLCYPRVDPYMSSVATYTDNV